MFVIGVRKAFVVFVEYLSKAINCKLGIDADQDGMYGAINVSKTFDES